VKEPFRLREEMMTGKCFVKLDNWSSRAIETQRMWGGVGQANRGSGGPSVADQQEFERYHGSNFKRFATAHRTLATLSHPTIVSPKARVQHER